MDKLFFFVTSTKAYKDAYGFHKNFFVDEDAFFIGLLLAFIIGVVAALIFYYGCCNSEKTRKNANLGTWVISLIVAGVATFLIADFIIIGAPKVKGNNSLFKSYSFYMANEKYYKVKVKEAPDPKAVKPILDEKNEIAKNLDSQKDVRIPYSAGCAVYSLIFFFICSIVVKGTTRHGAVIPFKWSLNNITSK